MLNLLIKESTLLKRVGIVKSISSLTVRLKDVPFQRALGFDSIFSARPAYQRMYPFKES